MKMKSCFVFLYFVIMIMLSLNAFGSSDLFKLTTETLSANCPHADPVSSGSFCASFKSVAECHCVASGLPAGMCKDMNAIYTRMLSVFGTQQKACEYQKDVPPQECMDDWNCYRLGGTDSSGNLCNNTGKSCQ